jgi:hypothetical protein
MGVCPSTIHAEDGEPQPEARFSGTFRAPWWDQDQVERVTYCLRCAAMMSSVRYFMPDEPSPEIQEWLEAKRATATLSQRD